MTTPVDPDELRMCADFMDGTRNGKLVPLADFTRERVAKALREAAAVLASYRPAHELASEAIKIVSKTLTTENSDEWSKGVQWAENHAGHAIRAAFPVPPVMETPEEPKRPGVTIRRALMSKTTAEERGRQASEIIAQFYEQITGWGPFELNLDPRDLIVAGLAARDAEVEALEQRIVSIEKIAREANREAIKQWNRADRYAAVIEAVEQWRESFAGPDVVASAVEWRKMVMALASVDSGSALAERDAEKWDEGYGDDNDTVTPRKNPYRAEQEDRDALIDIIDFVTGDYERNCIAADRVLAAGFSRHRQPETTEKHEHEFEDRCWCGLSYFDWNTEVKP